MKATSAVLVALLMHAAGAADLTREEQARLDVSKCYIACSDQVMRLGTPAFGASLLADSTYRFSYDYVWCQFVQILMTVGDTCQAGCRDLEAVYGATKSWTKTRHRYLFNELKADTKRSGLWMAYNDYPDPDDSPWAFQQACDRYLQ